MEVEIPSLFLLSSFVACLFYFSPENSLRSLKETHGPMNLSIFDFVFESHDTCFGMKIKHCYITHVNYQK